jgi:molybdopterin-guanine dinucleotide biosynthesis protein A
MRQYALLNASVTAMQQSQGRPPAMDLQEQLAELYNRPMTLVFDSAVEIGPAAGLLAAHALFPDASLLVVGCDYPLLTREAVGQLVAAHSNSDVTAPTTTTTTTTTPPVTCFINSAGFGEPLIAIWGTEALDALKTNVKVEGMSGLLRVVKEVGGQMVRPKEEEWIRGVNTKEEWEEVRGVLAERMGLRLELDGVVMGQGGSTEEGVVNMV